MCCSIYEIEKFNKPERVPCSHLCDKGCSIYETRPEDPCRKFKCAWLEGAWKDEDRPDKVGVVWTIKTLMGLRTATAAMQFVTPRGWEMVARIAGNQLVRVARSDLAEEGGLSPASLFGPDIFVQEYLKRADEVAAAKYDGEKKPVL